MISKRYCNSKAICCFKIEDRKYNTRDIQDLVNERYDLNSDLDMKDKIYLVNPHYVKTKLQSWGNWLCY